MHHLNSVIAFNGTCERIWYVQCRLCGAVVFMGTTSDGWDPVKTHEAFHGQK